MSATIDEIKETNKENLENKKRKTEKKLLRSKSKKWTVNGVILPEYRDLVYFVDPSGGNISLIEKIKGGDYVRLYGPRASGKSTRVWRAMEQLGDENYKCIYANFEDIDINNEQLFWKSLGECIDIESINNSNSFRKAFSKDNQTSPVVIFFDEFDVLLAKKAKDVRVSYLKTIRGIKHNKSKYAIQSIVAIGTFSILKLNQEDEYISPFNVMDNLEVLTFNSEQVNILYEEFADMKKLIIDPLIVQEIYTQTNGHPALVCLCGRFIDDHTTRGKKLNHTDWQSFLLRSSLQNEIAFYPTIGRMLNRLLDYYAKDSVDFLRSRFLSADFNSKKLILDNEIKHANFLSAEGVLKSVSPADNIFVMSSPILRSVILIRVISVIYPTHPLIEIPRRSDKSINILEALKDAVRVFDRENMRLAVSHSYKTAKLAINGLYNQLVPRESVYQQHLTAIFHNWFGTLLFEVMPQYHSRGYLNKHIYTDLVITAPKGYPQEPTAILEILATSTGTELEEHFERLLNYVSSFKNLNIRDIWIVHFTCADDFVKGLKWPTLKQEATGLNTVHFWHDLEFRTVRISARWRDENGQYQVNFNEQLFSENVISL